MKGKYQCLSPNNQYRVALYLNSKDRTKRRIYRLALQAFFPKVSPNETVDHIDEDHTNNFLENLQWMSRRNNSSKGHIGLFTQAKKRGKPVLQLDDDGKVLNEFWSSHEAERQTGINKRQIRTAATKNIRASGYYWRFKVLPKHKDLPGEIWKSSPTLVKILSDKIRPLMAKKVRISNMGRVKSCTGVIGIGSCAPRASKKYRSYSSWKIHHLVWAAFYDEDPRELEGVMCHDDGAPLREDGTYTNHLSTLRIDTQSSNTKEYHFYRKRKLAEGQPTLNKRLKVL